MADPRKVIVHVLSLVTNGPLCGNEMLLDRVGGKLPNCPNCLKLANVWGEMHKEEIDPTPNEADLRGPGRDEWKHEAAEWQRLK